MTRIVITLCIIELLLSGCYSMATRKQWFVDARNYEMGREIGIINGTPEMTKAETQDRSRVFFSWPNGCKWSVEVDDKFKTTLSWRFESDPNLCFQTMVWY